MNNFHEKKVEYNKKCIIIIIQYKLLFTWLVWMKKTMIQINIENILILFF